MFESLAFLAGFLLIVILGLSGPSLVRTVLRGPSGRFVLRPVYDVTIRPLIWLLHRTARVARGGAKPLSQEAQ